MVKKAILVFFLVLVIFGVAMFTWRSYHRGVKVSLEAGSAAVPSVVETAPEDTTVPTATTSAILTCSDALPITRADAARFLVEKLLIPTPTAGVPSFTDVPVTHADHAAIEAIYSKHITAGCSANPLKYCPSEAATRMQFISMLIRARGWTIVDPEKPSFGDLVASHSGYKYVETAKANGVLDAYKKSEFFPNQTILANEACEYIGDEPIATATPTTTPTGTPISSELSAESFGTNVNQGEAKAKSSVDAAPGDIVIISLVVRSRGAEKLTNVLVNNTLPKQLTYIAATMQIDGVKYGGASMPSEVTIPIIEPGQEHRIVFAAQVNLDADQATTEHVATIKTDKIAAFDAKLPITIKKTETP